MSKSANPGELRTRCTFVRKVETYVDGFLQTTEENVFGTGKTVGCKWVNAHGSDVYTSHQMEMRGAATLTTRYSPLLKDPTLIVYREADTAPYEIVSVDDVEERHAWLEITVRRLEDA